MISSSKARELSVLKNIEDQIIQAAKEGRYGILLTGLTNEQILLLVTNGYCVMDDTEWGDNYYYISWK